MPKQQSIGAEAKPPILTVYQLKVSLRGISPMIWRRLLVSSTTTIAHLHGILQVAMGWEDVHLHRFRVHGKDYGIYREGGIGFVDDPSQVTLADLKLRAHERFVYEYDFGDSSHLSGVFRAVLYFPRADVPDYLGPSHSLSHLGPRTVRSE
ncbi:MAG: plasmid pRiA4b ORF-3 family protein, partial [Oscillochloris sp.]|nr:plasmid pRiA4b ORF-3 family protein [Oscillochloris sp.]